MHLIPITLRQANDFVEAYHRHAKRTQRDGGKFAVGAMHDGRLVGVAIVGRPIARLLQDGMTAEVTRVCVLDDAPKGACSFLYGRCWRIWQQMGGDRMVTYTLKAESGASLRGAGWRIVGQRKGRGPTSWQRPDDSRDWNPVYQEPKFRWEASARG